CTSEIEKHLRASERDHVIEWPFGRVDLHEAKIPFDLRLKKVGVVVTDVLDLNRRRLQNTSSALDGERNLLVHTVPPANARMVWEETRVPKVQSRRTCWHRTAHVHHVTHARVTERSEQRAQLGAIQRIYAIVGVEPEDPIAPCMGD